MYRGICTASGNITIENMATVEAIYCDCSEKRSKCGVNFDSPSCDPSSGLSIHSAFNLEMCLFIETNYTTNINSDLVAS